MSPEHTHSATALQNLKVVREIVYGQSHQSGSLFRIPIIEDAHMGCAYRLKDLAMTYSGEKARSAVGCDRGFDLTHRLHPSECVGYIVKLVCAGNQVPEGELAILQELKRLVKMPTSP